MIADDIVPRHPELPHDAVVAGIERQVVRHDVAGREPEGGFGADQRVHHVVADEVELGRAPGMRVGEHEHLETARLVDLLQGEIDRARQWAARLDPAIAQAQMLGRAFGMMDVVEARQHGAALDRHRVAGRLDHENDGLVIDRQRIPPLGVGLHHLAPVGHEHAGYPGIARLSPAGARAVLENHAGRDQRTVMVREGRSHRRGRGGKRDGGAAAPHHVTPCDQKIPLHHHASRIMKRLCKRAMQADAGHAGGIGPAASRVVATGSAAPRWLGLAPSNRGDVACVV